MKNQRPWKSILLSAIAVTLCTFIHVHAGSVRIIPAKPEAIFSRPPTFFTQGLVYANATLYESTGKYGQSSVYKIALTRKAQKKTAKEKAKLLPEYFGEGITVINDQLYQLTWKSGTGFIYTLPEMSPEGTFNYSGHGWGLTHNGTHLLLSDGTSKIRFINIENFKQEKEITVTSNGKKISRLNELELVDNTLFANIWHADKIVAINPTNGKLRYVIDLKPLRSFLHKGAGVANGIARYAPKAQSPSAHSSKESKTAAKQKNSLLITGKYWNKYFTIPIPEISSQ